MSTQTGDMSELAVAIIILVVKLSIAIYFGAFILAGLSNAILFTNPFSWATAITEGAINGITGGS